MSAVMGALMMQKRLSGKKKKKEKEKKKAAISGSLTYWSLRPMEKEEVDKTVYLRVNSLTSPKDFSDRDSAKKEFSDWYKIKLSSRDDKDCCSTQIRKRKKTTIGRKEEPLRLEPILTKVKIPWRTCFVVDGSTIYCTSSGDHISSNVLALDTTTTTTSLQWKPVPSMKFKRDGRSSLAVAADGKIYVFGGLIHYCCSPHEPPPTPIREDVKLLCEVFDRSVDFWAAPTAPPDLLSIYDNVKLLCEVFDPSKNMWEPINAAAPLHLLPELFAVEDGVYALYDYIQRRIIFCIFRCHGFIVAYYVEKAAWETLAEVITPTSIASPDDCYCRSQPLFFDNTIYWIESNNRRLYAYDLNLKMLIYSTIVGLPHYFCETVSDDMQFLHFHCDDFYLIWLDYYERAIRCDRMRIFKCVDMQKQQGGLTAHVLSTKFYVTETPAHGIGAVLL